MWGLFVCARMFCIPKEQRLWAIVQLEKIGYEMAVRQALPLVNMIRFNANLKSDDALDPTWEDCFSINDSY
jgi:hypothetical protein